jgi:hypothetical protein
MNKCCTNVLKKWVGLGMHPDELIFCPECGKSLKKTEPSKVYCISCEHFRDDEYNWRSQKYEDGGEEWEMVGACWADENRKANWKSEEGARNKLPCNINANNDCPWYKNKYWGD